MKKVLKALLIVVPVGVVVCGFLAYKSFTNYGSPQSLNNLINKNLSAENYKRQISMSISFDEKSVPTELKDIVKNINNSILIVNETVEKDNFYQEYSLTSKGISFKGKRLLDNDRIIVKTPMHPEYVEFKDLSQLGLNYNDSSKHPISPDLNEFILSLNKDNVTVSTNLGLNENGSRTVTIKNENKNIGKLIKGYENYISDNSNYMNIFKEQALIKEKLQPNKLEDIKSLSKYRIKEFINSMEIKKSEASIKLNNSGEINDINLKVECLYVNANNGQRLKFTIYIECSLSDYNKSKVDISNIGINKSMLYEELIQDFKSNNGTSPAKNKKGDIIEDTSTLDSLGDNFIQVSPKKK